MGEYWACELAMGARVMHRCTLLFFRCEFPVSSCDSLLSSYFSLILVSTNCWQGIGPNEEEQQNHNAHSVDEIGLGDAPQYACQKPMKADSTKEISTLTKHMQVQQLK